MKKIVILQKLDRKVQKGKHLLIRSIVGVSWYMVLKNVFALILFTIVVFSSYKTLIKWNKKYDELKSETEVLKQLEGKKREKLHQKELLENREYIKIKAKEANYIDDKAMLYDVVDNANELDSINDNSRSKYVPPKGVNEWINLIF